MPNQIALSLVIATFNGEKTLPRALASINQMVLPELTTFNIIIIDNNSSDATATLLNTFKCKFSFISLFQIKAGKNAALNTIFNDSVPLGELIIFSDDDVIFPVNFLQLYCQLYRSHQYYTVFGGTVAPCWPYPPNQAMLAGIDPVVAFAITPPSAGYLDGEIDPIKLHGPNMAITLTAFGQDLRFNENIGPNGGNYVMGSETDILYKLKAKNNKAYFCSTLEVQHIIRVSQFQSKWLAARAFKAGRSLVHHHINQRNTNTVALLFHYPRWALAKYLKDSFKFYLQFGIKNISYYKHLWARNHIKGYLSEYKHQNSTLASKPK